MKKVRMYPADETALFNGDKVRRSVGVEVTNKDAKALLRQGWTDVEPPKLEAEPEPELEAEPEAEPEPKTQDDPAAEDAVEVEED